MVLLLNAKIVPVSTYAELSAANTSAADGDTFLLTNGYAPYDGAGADLTITKKIVIIPADTVTKMPQISKFGFKLMNNSSFVIKGVKAYYDAPGSTVFTDSKYFIQAVGEVASIDSIKLINCEVSNYGRGLIRADNTTSIATIGKMVVDNCLVTNTSAFNASYSTINVKTAKISNATVINSTFANCPSGIYLSQDSLTTTNILFKNVTVYNCGSNGTTNAKQIISITKATSGSSYIIENCAFSGSFNTAYTSAAISIISKSDVLPAAYTTKLLNSIVLVKSTASPLISATWTENTLRSDVSSFILDANYKISASMQLSNIGDPRGYPMSIIEAVKVISDNSSIKIVNGELVFNGLVKNAVIYSLNGRTIKSVQKVNQLPVNELKKGIYIIKITDANGVVKTQKFVK
jgi:hypothetical protein